jgi:hypothetical protein
MDEIGYNLQELRSFLPTGWIIPATEHGHWDAKAGTWKTKVLDGAEMSWDLVIRAKDVAAEGRIPALRRAFDELYRKRLG